MPANGDGSFGPAGRHKADRLNNTRTAVCYSNRHHGRWRSHVAALGLYALQSFFLLDHGVSVRTNILGITSDPDLFIWLLAWWPWSLGHHLNPLFTNLVWQPSGLHLAWTTSIPLLALLGTPITLLSGPVVTYNLLTLLAPVLSAFTAYFLCMRLTAKFDASLVGGYLFGFSSYEMAETLAHLNLDFTCLLPLLVLVALRRLEGQFSRAQAVFLASLLLVLEFYISVEVFATTVFFGSIAWLLAFRMIRDMRAALLHLITDAACGAPVIILLTSPLLFPMLFQPRDVVIPLGWTYVSAAHLFNLLAPSPETVLSNPSMLHLSYGLFGTIPEYDYTTGLPLLIILGLYAGTNWHSTRVRFAFLLLAIIFIASLGPQLWFGSTFTQVVLPWFLMLHIPLMNAALPVRFALYSSLVVAIMAALWIARPSVVPYRRRAGLGLLACICFTPAQHPVQPLRASAFFTPGQVQRQLGSHAKVLILPQQNADSSTLWQAESKFTFAQTEGYLGFPPQSMRNFPAVEDFMFGWKSAHLDQDISQLCRATSTQFVLSGPATPATITQAMNKLSWPHRIIDGVTIFIVPPT